jgi:SAM-dependent methyltransferase
VTGVLERNATVDLPLRYHTRWQGPFEDNIHSRLGEGMTLLDVGSGRHPTIDPPERPAHTTYVGLDISGEELRSAGPDAYDELIVADITSRVPQLLGHVDLAISWQVFEHVKPLGAALDNLHAYLRTGGTLVSLFSGRWSVFGVANRLIPDAVGSRLVERSMRRQQINRPVFPAHYDRCTYSALSKMTAGWSHVEIQPLFHAAPYFHFSRLLTRSYLAYENAACRAGLAGLATHYLLIAQR